MTHQYDSDTYGKRLAMARARKEVTQHQLSKMTGVSQATIGSAESTGRGSLHTAQFAKVLGVDAYWLATGEGEMMAEAIWPFETFTQQDIKALTQAERVYIETMITNSLIYLLSGHGVAPPVDITPLVRGQEASGNVKSNIRGDLESRNDDQPVTLERSKPVAKQQRKAR